MKSRFQCLFSWLFILVLIVSGCRGTSTEISPATNNPEIQFYADSTDLQETECTVVHWNSQIGFGVIFDEQPVDPVGEREVCPPETQVYVLAVDMGTYMEHREIEIHVGSQGAPVPAESTGTSGPRLPAYQADSWVYMGGPLGGLGYDVRMDPSNPDRMYVTDAYAGAFKSTDGGQTWFAINNGIIPFGATNDVYPVFSLTIDPNNPETLWAGEQNTSQIYRSVDAGENWVSMNTGSNGITERGLSFRGITIEPGNSNVVYIAAEVPSIDWYGANLTGHGFDMTMGVIFKSTNGGQTWTRLWKGDHLCRYIWINPENHNILYASTGIFDREAANSNAAANDPGGVGILRSMDAGQTWEVLGPANGFDPEDLYFGSLFMHPQNPRILIAASGNDPFTPSLGHALGGVYLTEDGGDTWEEILDGHNFSSVEICTSNPDIVYATARTGFFRSEDGGHTWEQTGESLWGPVDVVAGWPIDIQCDPRDAMRLFVNAYGGGVFLSEDGGVTWVASSQGYTGALMFDIGIDSSDSSHIFASARSGIFTSTDGGETWLGLNSGLARDLEAYALAVDPDDPNHILAGYRDSANIPRVSFDGGQTWSEVDTGMSRAGGVEATGISHFEFAPGNSSMVLAAVTNVGCHWDSTFASCALPGYGVILSRDGGDTWETTSLSSGQVMDISISSNSQRAYAALYDGSLYRSENGGQTWQSATSPTSAIPTSPDADLGSLIIKTVTVSPEDLNLVFAGFLHGGVAISLDGGETWTASSAGMPPEASVVSIVIDPTNPNVVYAGAINAGVFFSQDGGMTWTALNTGLVNRQVRKLAITNDGSVLYMTSQGAGVFRLGTP